MIANFIREDPAYRRVGKWVIFSVLAATLILNIATFQAAKRAELGETAPMQNLVIWYTALAWLLVTTYLVFGSVRTRCSAFGMSLPISSRSLWMAHMTAVLVVTFVIFTLFVVIAIVGGKFLSELTDKPPMAVGDAVRATIHLMSLSLLGVALLDLRSPLANKVRQDARGTALAIVVAIAMLLVTALMMSLPTAVAAIPPIFAAGIAARRFRSLPRAFFVAPDREAVSVDATDAIASWKTVPRSTLSGWMQVAGVVYRSTFTKKAAPYITIPFIMFFGLLLAGMDEVWIEENLRSLAVTLTAYLLMAVVMEPIIQIRRIDAFPISRRRIFALLIVPCLVFLAAGYGAGRWWIENRVAEEPNEAICFCQSSDGYYYTRVPIEYCRLGRSGDVPENKAPWGESHEAWRSPLFKGSHVQFYSPFSVGEGASIDFAALQISRATEAIFGEAITPEEIKRRYLRERTDGSAALAVDDLTLQRDFPQLRRQHAGPMFPILFTLVCVLWLAAIRVYLGVMRAGNSKRRRMSVGFMVMAGLFALYVLIAVAAWAGFMEEWASIGLLQILARDVAGAFWGSEVLVWIGCFAVIATVYRWTEKKFLRMECLREEADAGAGCW